MTFPVPDLTADQRRIVDLAAGLSRERFAARAARYDEESAFPYENYADLRAAGLLGLTVPREFGGLGADPLTYALVLLEVAKGCSATALTFNMHCTVLSFVAELGSVPQKRKYFDDVIRDGKLIASVTSEPESSFRDKVVLRTVFDPLPGDRYHVTGYKNFCSLGDAADYYFVSGIRAGAKGARDGLLSAVIPREAGGVKVERLWNAVGMRGTISHAIRYDTTVEREQVIGGVADLLTIDLSGFALGYAATYLGIGEAAFEYAVDYAKTRKQLNNEALCYHPTVQRTIAEMAISVRTARLLLFDAARTRATGDREASMLAVNQSKAYSCEVGLDVTTKAIRLAGGRGILKELPFERLHRDALAGPVMPPANDRCLETAGKLLCGLRAATLEYL